MGEGAPGTAGCEGASFVAEPPAAWAAALGLRGTKHQVGVEAAFPSSHPTAQGPPAGEQETVQATTPQVEQKGMGWHHQMSLHPLFIPNASPPRFIYWASE